MSNTEDGQKTVLSAELLSNSNYYQGDDGTQIWRFEDEPGFEDGSIYVQAAFGTDPDGYIIQGTNFSDNLQGATHAVNEINGGAGDDNIRGGVYADKLVGGNGDDLLKGNRGDDHIEGNNGNDQLSGERGDDTLLGGHGDDSLYGGIGDDLIKGGFGNDIIEGDTDSRFGSNETFGVNGDDMLYGNAGDDIINGNAGNDQLFGGQDNDTLNGGEGDDYLQGNTGNDTLDGGEGDDTVHGGRGDDQVYGGEGSDLLYGGFGADDFMLKVEAGNELDTIADFNVDEGDMIVLQDVLDMSAGDNLEDFLMLTEDSEGNTTISVDLDGQGNEHAMKDIAVVRDTGVDLVEQALEIITNVDPDII